METPIGPITLEVAHQKSGQDFVLKEFRAAVRRTRSLVEDLGDKLKRIFTIDEDTSLGDDALVRDGVFVGEIFDLPDDEDPTPVGVITVSIILDSNGPPLEYYTLQHLLFRLVYGISSFGEDIDDHFGFALALAFLTTHPVSVHEIVPRFEDRLMTSPPDQPL